MFVKFILISAFALMIPAVSCQKETLSNFTPSEVLPTGKWQLKKLFVENPPGSGAADITATTFNPCELDDLIEFKQGGNFSCTENSNICVVNRGVFYNLSGGTWVLSGDTLLTIAAGFNVQKYHFGKILMNSVELQQSLTNYLGEISRYTFLLGR